MTVLRPYQVRTVQQARQQYAQGSRAICIVAPCGAGKTIIGSTIACGALQYGRVLWIAHRQELIDQARIKLPAGAIEVRTIQGMLASGERPPAEMVVLDECHHYVADEWKTVADYYKNSLIIGLTATPERGDGTPLGDLFTSMVVSANYSELLAGGWIVPCDVFAPYQRYQTLSANPEAVVLQYGSTQRTILFASTVNEARRIALALPNAACVDGKTPTEERAKSIRDFREGKLGTLTNVYVLTEGFDVPETEVCVLARGFSHPSTYLQCVGRALRPAPNKNQATVIDLCGVVNDFGFPTQDREYSLKGDAIKLKGGKGKVIVWQCKFCGFCLGMEPANRLCPECGQRMPEPEAIKVQKRKIARRAANAVAPFDKKVEAWKRLLTFARVRGYKPGWAAAVYKARYGESPSAAHKAYKNSRFDDEDADIPSSPTGDIRGSY